MLKGVFWVTPFFLYLLATTGAWAPSLDLQCDPEQVTSLFLSCKILSTSEFVPRLKERNAYNILI